MHTNEISSNSTEQDADVNNNTSDELAFHDITHPPFDVPGFPWLRENGNWFRLPMAQMPTLRDGLTWVAWQPAGNMVRVRSNSRRIAVKVQLLRNETFAHSTQMQQSGIDIYLGTGSDSTFLQNLAPARSVRRYRAEAVLPPADGMTDITFYLPLLNPLRRLQVGVEAGSTLSAPTPFPGAKPIAYYGSSITQGFCASRPGLTYPALLGRALNMPWINLGFGGNALGDREVAEAISSLELSALVLDYDHNAGSAEFLEQTHAAFFAIIRKRQPLLPVLILTAPTYYADAAYYANRAAVIQRTYQHARAAGDRHVYFLHGETFFPERGWKDRTVDGTHPNDLGFHEMAQAILPVLRLALAEQDTIPS